MAIGGEGGGLLPRKRRKRLSPGRERRGELVSDLRRASNSSRFSAYVFVHACMHGHDGRPPFYKGFYSFLAVKGAVTDLQLRHPPLKRA